MGSGFACTVPGSASSTPISACCALDFLLLRSLELLLLGLVICFCCALDLLLLDPISAPAGPWIDPAGPWICSSGALCLLPAVAWIWVYWSSRRARVYLFKTISRILQSDKQIKRRPGSLWCWRIPEKTANQHFKLSDILNTSILKSHTKRKPKSCDEQWAPRDGGRNGQNYDIHVVSLSC